VAVIDPVLGQALSILAGAVAMAIVSIVSYYFPKGHDRFDERERRHDDDDESDRAG
jgi:hypothetical protein